jgi:hypothetical protein
MQGYDGRPWVLLRHRHGWAAVPGRGLRSSFEISAGVGLSRHEAWLVGKRPLATPPTAEHWTGSTWTSTAAPLPQGAVSGAFNAVARVPGTGDVVAVGKYVAPFEPDHPYAAMWDGSGWAQLPMAGLVAGTAHAVTALSATDAWLVGRRGDGRPLIEHWDGSLWTEAAGPDVGTPVTLADVAAASSTDVVAVGYRGDCGNAPCVRDTVTVSFDGAAWSRVPSTNPSAKGVNALYGAAAIPGTKLFWAVGEVGQHRELEGSTRTLVEQCRC